MLSSSKSNDILYIKKYGLLEDEQLTRLSNGVVQMLFKDLSSLILYLPDDKCLFYVGKRGEEESYEYDDVEMVPNLRLQKKMKKFSQVLKMLSNKQSTQ